MRGIQGRQCDGKRGFREVASANSGNKQQICNAWLALLSDPVGLGWFQDSSFIIPGGPFPNCQNFCCTINSNFVQLDAVLKNAVRLDF